MLRAVSAGAAFLLFLGGRRVSNAGMSFFRYSFVGCARQRCVWRFCGVLLRIARGKGVLSKPCGTAARAVRGSCEAVRLFLRSLRGQCAAKAGVAMLCGVPSRAAYVQRMGIRVFSAPLREFTAGDRPISGFLRPPFRAWAGIGRADAHIFFFYAFLLISFFPCAILK